MTHNWCIWVIIELPTFGFSDQRSYHSELQMLGWCCRDRTCHILINSQSRPPCSANTNKFFLLQQQKTRLVSLAGLVKNFIINLLHQTRLNCPIIAGAASECHAIGISYNHFYTLVHFMRRVKLFFVFLYFYYKNN